MFKDKSPFQIFGMFLALGAGIMLFLSLASSGFRDALMNFASGMGAFRPFRMEFMMFLFSMLFFVGLASLIFGGKKS